MAAVEPFGDPAKPRHRLEPLSVVPGLSFGERLQKMCDDAEITHSQHKKLETAHNESRGK